LRVGEDAGGGIVVVAVVKNSSTMAFSFLKKRGCVLCAVKLTPLHPIKKARGYLNG